MYKMRYVIRKGIEVFILGAFVWMNPLTGQAQQSKPTQVIKGQVIDQQSQIELIGAHVFVEGTSLGDATDPNGNFRIKNVPVGRHTIKVMYIGYKSRIIPEIMVGSAKEVVLTVELQEDIIEGQEIVVTPQVDKNMPLNTMSTVSARSFSVEETRRYAGGFDDPARLASSFAGVTYGNAQDNAIIIRGNAPKGLLWRLEGVEIPNPNHFPDGNVMGGGMFTIFSNHLLANSDFMTGAFPAEYGNALSGVFDMKFRNGNSDVREYTFQAGMLGIDFSTEGPFSSKSNASYLVNYRYSTFGLIMDLGLVDTEQVPRYQDLSFKVHVPTQHAGTFALWGIGSIDDIEEFEEPNPELWEEDWDRIKFDGGFNTSALGLNHRFIFGKSTYLNSTIANTTYDMTFDMDRLDDQLQLRDNELAEIFDGRSTVTTTLNHKFSARLNQSTGVTWNYLYYDLNLESTTDNDPETYQTYVDEKGHSQHWQAFTQVQYNITADMAVNAGVHAEYFVLNSNYSVEPRAGITWGFHPRHSISLGYGRHSQLEDLQYYLARRSTPEGIEMPNKDLDFTYADHVVLAYDFRLSENTRIKIEPYYQYLSNVPVRDETSFSFLNLKDERYYNEPLVNEGTGENIGVDLTFEKFLSDGYYYLVTASLFDSKYVGGDGVERDTRYNRAYVINALGGKEFQVRDRNMLGINARFTYMGGERISPVMRTLSLQEERVIHDESRAFEASLDGSHYLDFTTTYRINKTNVSHIIALQIKNMLGSPNDYGWVYNYKEEALKRSQEVIVLPSISYKIEF